MLKDFHRAPRTGGLPQHAVVFLHGVGDRGDGGLLSIGELWQQALPDCEFICPDAPFPFDMAPPDFGGRQWFSLKNLSPSALEEGAEEAAPFLNEYLDHVLKTRNLTPDRLALVGFSQGTMMALYVALRREQPLACVVGYSGLLIGGDTLSSSKHTTLPILLVHGKNDDVVPFSALHAAETALVAAHIPVQICATNSAHTIDNVGVTEGLRFIHSHWRG